MDKKLEPIVKAIQDKFSAIFEEFRDEVHLFVKPGQIVDALTLLLSLIHISEPTRPY